jgi:hypothetical protein
MFSSDISTCIVDSANTEVDITENTIKNNSRALSIFSDEFYLYMNYPYIFIDMFLTFLFGMLAVFVPIDFFNIQTGIM